MESLQVLINSNNAIEETKEGSLSKSKSSDITTSR